jgi:hypothetical protein
LQFNHLLFASSPGLWVSSVANPGLLLIYLFIYYFFVAVSAAGRKSTTKCIFQHGYSKKVGLIFFFNLCGGTLGNAAKTGLLFQPRMIDDGDCGEIDGIKIGRGNRSAKRKPAPAPLCPPQIPHA